MDEVDVYLRTRIAEDGLTYWSRAQDSPLRRLALDLLTEPATTGTCERTFSKARWMSPYVRNRMEPELLRASLRLADARRGARKRPIGQQRRCLQPLQARLVLLCPLWSGAALACPYRVLCRCSCCGRNTNDSAETTREHTCRHPGSSRSTATSADGMSATAVTPDRRSLSSLHRRAKTVPCDGCQGRETEGFGPWWTSSATHEHSAHRAWIGRALPMVWCLVRASCVDW